MDSITRLVDRLNDRHFDAALISDPNAIWYFTGVRFSPGERLLALVVTKDAAATLLVNRLFLYDGTLPAVWYSDAQDGVAMLAQLLEGHVAVDKSFPARFLLRLQEIKPELKLTLGTVIDEVKAVKTPQEQQWQVGPLFVCPQRRQVQVNGQDVLLTYKEFEILSLLLQQQGRVMTREMLMDRVWGLEADRENRTLDVHIRTLRQKLGEAGHLIETVRGVGYKIGGRA